MPRTCSVCVHDQRADIDQLLVSGTSLRSLAEQFSLSGTALHRHKTDHIPASIKQAAKAREAVLALDVVGEMRWCNTRAHYIHDRTSSGDEPDYRTALAAVGEVRKQAELWAEIQGELDRSTHIDIHQDPQWQNMRDLILRALAPFPEALAAVAEALYEEGSHGRLLAS